MLDTYMNNLTDRQINRWIDRQIDIWIDRQTDRERDRTNKENKPQEFFFRYRERVMIQS